METHTIRRKTVAELRGEIAAAGGPPPHLREQYRSACRQLDGLNDRTDLGFFWPALQILGLVAAALGIAMVGYVTVEPIRRVAQAAGEAGQVLPWLALAAGGIWMLNRGRRR